MPRWIPGVLLALCALCGAHTASAFTHGDTLTLIWKPLPNLPAIVRPGEDFTVWVNAPSSASGFTAALRTGAFEAPLAPAGGGWRPSLARWVMSFRVPATVGTSPTPEELYDLSLDCTGCAPDVARHAGCGRGSRSIACWPLRAPPP
jgi:hypothetical protein